MAIQITHSPMVTLEQPSENSMSARRGRRGQKISACDSCWKRKVKCDAAIPICFWCEHYQIPCVYERKGIRLCRARPVLPPPIEALNFSHRNEVSFSTRQGGNSGTHDYSRSDLPLCSLIRIPYSSAVHQEWTRFKAGQLVSTERLCRNRFGQRSLSSMPLFPSFRSHTESDLINATILPDRALVERCARLYMRSMARATFPYLHPYLFKQTVTLAYEATDHMPSHVMSAKACVIAFSTFSYLVPFGIRLCSTPKFNHYTALLQQVLPTITEAATVDGFQACMFLVWPHNALFLPLIVIPDELTPMMNDKLLSQFITGKLRSAAVTNSIAAHFVFYLGAHNAWSMQSSNQEQHSLQGCVKLHLRNLFWACYTIDKDLCFRVLQPPALGDNHCDLSLPLQYMEKISEELAIGRPFDEFHPSIMFPTDIKLSQIKSRAYESLHSIAAFRKPAVELLVDIRNLDSTLEAWRLAIPENYRPSLSFSYDMEVHPGSLDLRTLILRLDYLYCVTVIHRASNRCLGTGMSFDGMETVIASSIALAVEASRSILKYLQAAYKIINEGFFWVIIFYLLAASVTISCNIIDNPALPSATHDYELLKDVPRLMCHMSTHGIEAEEILHRDQLKVFFKELIDAAERVISSMRERTPPLRNDDHTNIDLQDGLGF